MASKINLTLADKVYEMAITHKLYGMPVPISKIDHACKQNRYHRGGTIANWYRNLQQDMMKAEKICLDDDFVWLTLEQRTAGLKKISTRLQLARNPFPITWIEWDSRVMYKHRTEPYNDEGIVDPFRIGYLIRSTTDDGSVFNTEEFALVDHQNENPVVFPYKIFFNTETPVFPPPARYSFNGERLNLNTHALRTSYLIGNSSSIKGLYSLWEMGGHFPPLLDQIALDYNDISYSMKFGGPKKDGMQEVFHKEIFACSGIGNFVTTALALINEAVIEYRYTTKHTTRRFVGSKTLPYMTHRTVHIEVPGKVKNVVRYFDRLLKTAEIRHRAHQVRGFWRTIHKHTSEERKVWIKPHIRGDASLGWVNQQHIVTTPPEPKL